MKSFFLIIVIIALLASAGWAAGKGDEVTQGSLNNDSITIYRNGQDGLNGRDGRDGIDGVDGKDGRDGLPATLNLKTGYIEKLVPVSKDRVTDNKGNTKVVVGQLSNKELEEIRSNLTAYGVVENDGSVKVFNLDGKLRTTLPAGTVNMTRWDALEKDVRNLKAQTAETASVLTSIGGLAVITAAFLILVIIFLVVCCWLHRPWLAILLLLIAVVGFIVSSAIIQNVWLAMTAAIIFVIMVVVALWLWGPGAAGRHPQIGGGGRLPRQGPIRINLPQPPARARGLIA